MTLRAIKPAWADDDLVAVAAMITASNATETVAVWNSVTAYTIGQRARLDTTHMIYECLIANNGKSPDTHLIGTTPEWGEVQAANKFAMLDAVNNSQTVQADVIDLTLSPGRFNALYLGGLSAKNVQVIVKAGTTTLHDQLHQLVRDNVFSWSQWTNDPIIRDEDLVLFDLPVSIGATVRVIINQPGGTARCGTLVVGMARDLGETQWGAGFRIKSNSVYKDKGFGRIGLNKRPAARRVSAPIRIPMGMFDEVNRLMMEFDAVNLLWSFSDEFKSLNVYGYCEDFDNGLPTYNGAIYNLKVMGLI